jgi:hypothetical protein
LSKITSLLAQFKQLVNLELLAITAMPVIPTKKTDGTRPVLSLRNHGFLQFSQITRSDWDYWWSPSTQLFALFDQRLLTLLSSLLGLDRSPSQLSRSFQLVHAGFRWGQGLDGFDVVEFVKSHQVFMCSTAIGVLNDNHGASDHHLPKPSRSLMDAASI